MKRVMSIVLAAAMALAALPVFAEDNAAQIFYTVFGDEAAVTGGNNLRGDIEISAYYMGRPVTKIGYAAFEDNTFITSVKIPETVTEIEDWAFHGCKSLLDVSMPEGLRRIGFAAFFGCEALMVAAVPKSVEKVEDYAFAMCSNLMYITFDNANTVISERAIYPYRLAEITMPEETVLPAEDNTASGTITLNLESGANDTLSLDGCFGDILTVPALISGVSVTSFKVTDMTMHPEVKTIELPASVRHIDTKSLDLFTNLEKIIVDENNKNYKTINGLLFDVTGKKLLYMPQGKKIIPTQWNGDYDTVYIGEYQGNVKVSMDLYLGSGTFDASVGFFSSDISLKDYWKPYEGLGGQVVFKEDYIKYYNPTTQWHTATGIAYAPNTRYSLTFDVDTVKQTYDVYVNSVLAVRGAGFRNTVGTNVAYLGVWDATGTENYYVANVKVEQR